MISFWRIFSLELLALWRSKTLALLTVASVGWMLVFPLVVRSDGTAEGAHEMYVHYSLGGVFALLLVSLLASATGSLARERAAKRLQLTLVRPVRHGVVVLAKIAALTVAGALMLALASAMLALRTDLGRPCSHVLRPELPSVEEEAQDMYASYMADPNTSAEVRRAPKETVLRLLANRARDHYQTLGTNAVTVWRFRLTEADGGCALKVRMRFTNAYDMRQEVRGTFRIGEAAGVVSNFTQAVTVVPLAGAAGAARELTFENRGRNALMLRPRRDLELLVAGDAFGWNIVRAYLEMVSVLALAIAFGLFLSAGLGRPVALFVAIATLAVSEMSPSVVERYPDELETKSVDRAGLALARTMSEVTHPVSSLAPLAKLASDECVEPREVVRVIALDLLALPLLLALISAFVLPRKQDGV